MRRKLNIKLREDDIEYLDDIAKKEKCSRSRVMTLILEGIIEKKKEKEDLTITV